MNKTGRRDEAFRVARADADQAARVGRSIDHPWFRTQALAAAARHAPGSQVERLALEAERAAGEGDGYTRSAVLAWPLRALIERGETDAARAMNRRARAAAAALPPHGGHAAALFMLLQAAWPLGVLERRALLHDLAQLEHETDNWRARRCVREAALMAHTDDPEFAHQVADGIRDERTRRRALRELAAGKTHEPRTFY